MFRVVLDTNIIVSALWSPQGIPAEVLKLVVSGKITTVLSNAVIDEYEDVLRRKKFEKRFSLADYDVDGILNIMYRRADYYVLQESTTPPFTDETDRKFYDLAKSANAYLITGNIKHFPQDNKIITPADFLQYFSKKL